MSSFNPSHVETESLFRSKIVNDPHGLFRRLCYPLRSALSGPGLLDLKDFAYSEYIITFTEFEKDSDILKIIGTKSGEQILKILKHLYSQRENELIREAIIDKLRQTNCPTEPIDNSDSNNEHGLPSADSAAEQFLASGTNHTEVQVESVAREPINNSDSNNNEQGLPNAESAAALFLTSGTNHTVVHVEPVVGDPIDNSDSNNNEQGLPNANSVAALFLATGTNHTELQVESVVGDPVDNSDSNNEHGLPSADSAAAPLLLTSRANPTEVRVNSNPSQSNSTQERNFWKRKRNFVRIAMISVVALIAVAVSAGIRTSLSPITGNDGATPPTGTKEIESFPSESVPDIGDISRNFANPNLTTPSSKMRNRNLDNILGWDFTLALTTGSEGTTPQTPFPNKISNVAKSYFNFVTSQKPTPTLPRTDFEKEDIRNWKHAFHIPSMTTYTLDTVRDLALHRRTICSNNSSIALIINQSKEFNDKDLSLSCNPEGVKALNLSGYMSLLNLATIIRTLPHITYLNLNLQGICDFVDDHLSTVIKLEDINTIVLGSLKYLRLMNVTNVCMLPLRLVQEKIIADNLTTLSLSKFNVQITNLKLVEETVLSFKSIRDFSFSGQLCPKCNLFMDNAAANWTSEGLHVLDFHVENESGFDINSGTKSVRNLLKAFGNDLKYLNSNVPITKRGFSGSGKNLLFINVTLSVTNRRSQFSAKFFEGFPKLRESHVRFKFETVEEGQTLVITDLVKYMDKRREINPFVLSATKDVNLKIYTNEWKLSCRNWSMDSSANIVSYVWE